MGALEAVTVRAAVREDAAAVATLLAADEAAFTGHPSRLGKTDVLDWWARTDLAASSWLLEKALA